MTPRVPTTLLANQAGDGAAFHLVVMGPELFQTLPLPASGALTIGRAETADVRLSDPLASRLHARLHVEGGGFAIEDLGSINKTRIREQPLSPGARAPIVPGEAIAIGSTVLMVQRVCENSRPRRVWPHGYFEARLEEECARSATTRDPFAMVRLRVERGLPVGRLIDAIAPALRLPDMLAVYGPDEYEILLASTAPDLARAMASDLMARLGEAPIRAQLGLACYPQDGRTPDALIASVSARLRGESQSASVAPLASREPAMVRLRELAERAAAGTISVLVVGETGVGKEVMAETIHRLSPRQTAPFLCVNCASLTENLLESELFGHERGAFTGAQATKPGLLETAPGGTVFLDEIGELPLTLQAKLLRVLETREVIRVGGLRPRPIDVRFVAATNRTLAVEVAQGRFRKDLYFRLNGVTLHIPPLRERRGEIAALARTFIAQLSPAAGRRAEPALSAQALALLERYPWPGNIRELRNVIERALLLCTGPEITPDHLPMDTMEATLPMLEGFRPERPAPEDEDRERALIVRTLAENAGNQSRAARALGISRSTLVERLERFGLPRPRKGV